MLLNAFPKIFLQMKGEKLSYYHMSWSTAERTNAHWVKISREGHRTIATTRGSHLKPLSYSAELQWRLAVFKTRYCDGKLASTKCSFQHSKGYLLLLRKCLLRFNCKPPSLLSVFCKEGLFWSRNISLEKALILSTLLLYINGRPMEGRAKWSHVRFV